MLRIENIRKIFNPGTVNEKIALDGVDLVLNDGEFVTVIGSNGAGKSTLLNAIAGVWLVDEGKINAAEDRLFELIESTAWDRQQAAALVLAFYDDVNNRDDEFLAVAGFPRDEIISGMEDAMRAIGMEIPEYLRIG